MIIMIGCSVEKQNKEILTSTFKGDKEAKKLAQQSYLERNKYVELTETEIKDIIRKNVGELEERFKALQSEHHDWLGQNWLNDSSIDQVAYDDAITIIKEYIKDIVSEEWVKDKIPTYLEAYWCECDGFDLITADVKQDDFAPRFQIEYQSKGHFEVSYIQYESVYTPGGTKKLSYLKDNETWKLDCEQWISPEEQSLNITIEDLQRDLNPDYKKVEDVTIDGEEFLIYESDDGQRYAINIRDSSENYDLTTEHNEEITEIKEAEEAEKEKKRAEEEKAAKEQSDSEAKKTESKQKEKQKQPNVQSPLANYETIEKEHIDGEDEIIVSYPYFSETILDDIITPDMAGRFNDAMDKLDALVKSREELDYVERFLYKVSFDNPFITEDFISIKFIESIYEGGTHGEYWSDPFNYDLKNNKVITLETILKEKDIDLETISDLTIRQIESGEVDIVYFEDKLEEALSPEIENFKDFVLRDNSIIFHFQPYHVGTYYARIVEVEIDWDAF